MFDVEEIKDFLKKNMSFKRFEHSLLVALEAKNLAKVYNYDENIAYITGLTHDIAKEFSDEKKKFYIDKYNLENINENIIHADIGSIFCRENYHFSEEMCQAIKAHTIGNDNMSLLDKIIFIADKIGRKNLSPFGQEVKKLAYKDLDSSICLYLENKKEEFAKFGKQLQPITLKLLDDLQKNKLEK